MTGRGENPFQSSHARSATQEGDAMLVLTRKLMEKLYIGNEITVTVVRLEGGQVRLGIDAPKEIAVVRGELRPIAEKPAGDPAPRPLGDRIRKAHPAPRGIDIRRREPSR